MDTKYRIISNLENTKFRIQHLEEKLASKIVKIFAPEIKEEFEWIDISTFGNFTNLIDAKNFLETIKNYESENIENWEVVG